MSEMAELIWVAHRLYERGQACGTAGNISLFQQEGLLISAGGSCFAAMQQTDFCLLDMDGNVLTGGRPSKEWPIHMALYRLFGNKGVVIHTHGFYTALWSCLPGLNPQNPIPAYTPYLNMTVGKVQLVPYAEPGSKELFDLFEKSVHIDARAYLLAHHGAVVYANTAMLAFSMIEEVENAARLAWCLRQTKVPQISQGSLEYKSNSNN